MVNKMSRGLVKSPLNYTGGKFALLEQILPYFPDDIDTFVDLFGGGFNVGVNVDANKIVYNDIVTQICELIKVLSTLDEHKIISHINSRIREYDLSKVNQEGFNKFRQMYNKSPSALDLYVLICFSFNHQIRFNSKMQYNNPFGKNKSSFTKSLQNKLENFIQRLQELNLTIENKGFDAFDFSNLNSRDFVYCDPPYLISTASYNDGKRGYTGWDEKLESTLLNILDELNRNGIRFALSNVIKHKGKENHLLKEWSKSYNVYFLNYDYSNSNYQAKDRRKNSTEEVLITNY